MRPRKIVVIGGGPAALSSAIYGLRAGHKVVLVERESIGGQIATSPLVENYPAFPKGSGLELSNAMFEQAMAIGAEMEPDEALSVEKKENRFLVHCQYTDIEADAVILATGAKHRELGIPGEKENVGKGVYYCAVCDSFQVEGKRAIVIGDGNSAVQYANYLAKTAKEVEICTLFDRFFAEKGLVDTLAALPNVHVHPGISSKAIENNGNTLRVLFEGTDSHEKLSLECEGIFVAIGQGLGALFSFDFSQLGSVVAMGSVLSQSSAAMGWGRTFFFYGGYLALNLAILNLIPIPGLDGWQLLVTGVEKVFRRKIPDKIKNIVSYVGLGLLLLLGVGIIVKDVIGLF